MSFSDVILENFIMKFVFSLLIVHTIVFCDKNTNEIFQFPEFDYKETSKNVSYTYTILSIFPGPIIILHFQELTYREFESACEQSSRCEHHLSGIVRTRCVRECISPSCYQNIYRFDEVSQCCVYNIYVTFFKLDYLLQLEEGEIDVRLISFKGCFIQRSGRSRNR